MDPGGAVVGNAVAAGVWSYEGLLLGTVDFAAGLVYGAGVSERRDSKNDNNAFLVNIGSNFFVFNPLSVFYR